MLTLEDFNANFSTTIIKFTKEDQVCCIGFKIKCLQNNRLFYMQTCVDNLESESDIVNVGWSNLLPSIKTWATQVMNATAEPFVPAGFDTEKFDIYTSRFDTYPENTPYCWCVGFTCIQKANPSVKKYADTQVNVDMEQYTSEQTIMESAWNNVKGQFESWITEVNNTPQLLNTSFSSSNW
jgi:hypothetical protein